VVFKCAAQKPEQIKLQTQRSMTMLREETVSRPNPSTVRLGCRTDRTPAREKGVSLALAAGACGGITESRADTAAVGSGCPPSPLFHGGRSSHIAGGGKRWFGRRGRAIAWSVSRRGAVRLGTSGGEGESESESARAGTQAAALCVKSPRPSGVSGRCRGRGTRARMGWTGRDWDVTRTSPGSVHRSEQAGRQASCWSPLRIGELGPRASSMGFLRLERHVWIGEP
jgi:hypothetical protein